MDRCYILELPSELLDFICQQIPSLDLLNFGLLTCRSIRTSLQSKGGLTSLTLREPTFRPSAHYYSSRFRNLRLSSIDWIYRFPALSSIEIDGSSLCGSLQLTLLPPTLTRISLSSSFCGILADGGKLHSANKHALQFSRMFPYLTDLRLNGNFFSVSASFVAEFFRGLPKTLKSLAVHRLPAETDFESLAHLDLVNCIVDINGLYNSFFPNIKSLQSLEWTQLFISEASVSLLNSFQNLATLILKSETTIFKNTHIIHFPRNLQVLELQLAKLTPEAIEALPRKLKSLTITKIIDAQPEIVDHFELLPPELTSLKCTLEMRKPITDISKIPRTITNLSLALNYSTYRRNIVPTVECFVGSPDLTFSQPIREPLGATGQIFHYSGLQHLDLYYDSAKLEPFILAQLPRSLLSLSFNAMLIEDKHIANLPRNLQSLRIDEAPLNDDCIPLLPPNLTRLEISCPYLLASTKNIEIPGFTDSCFENLPQTLTELSLPSITFTGSAIKAATLKGFPKPTSLNENVIFDAVTLILPPCICDSIRQSQLRSRVFFTSDELDLIDCYGFRMKKGTDTWSISDMLPGGPFNYNLINIPKCVTSIELPIREKEIPTPQKMGNDHSVTQLSLYGAQVLKDSSITLLPRSLTRLMLTTNSSLNAEWLANLPPIIEKLELPNVELCAKSKNIPPLPKSLTSLMLKSADLKSFTEQIRKSKVRELVILDWSKLHKDHYHAMPSDLESLYLGYDSLQHGEPFTCPRDHMISLIHAPESPNDHFSASSVVALPQKITQLDLPQSNKLDSKAIGKMPISLRHLRLGSLTINLEDFLDVDNYYPDIEDDSDIEDDMDISTVTRQYLKLDRLVVPHTILELYRQSLPSQFQTLLVACWKVQFTDFDIPRLPDGLTYLDIELPNVLSDASLPQLPHTLTDLNLGKQAGITNKNLHLLPSHIVRLVLNASKLKSNFTHRLPPDLKSLTVLGVSSPSTDYKKLLNLNNLIIENPSNINDEFIAQLPETLERLEIWNAEGLTENFVLRLSSFRRLKTLLLGCSKLKELHAIPGLPDSITSIRFDTEGLEYPK